MWVQPCSVWVELVALGVKQLAWQCWSACRSAPQAALLLCPLVAWGKVLALAKCAGRRAVGVFNRYAQLAGLRAVPLKEQEGLSCCLFGLCFISRLFSFELSFDTDLISFWKGLHPYYPAKTTCTYPILPSGFPLASCSPLREYCFAVIIWGRTTKSSLKRSSLNTTATLT